MLAKVLMAVIRAYQLGISAWTPARCRFHPTCSEYARQAIAKHGPLRGVWFGTKRICRCHPLGGHGYDPVPERPGVEP